MVQMKRRKSRVRSSVKRTITSKESLLLIPILIIARAVATMTLMKAKS
jgi:hypothetical protein